MKYQSENAFYRSRIHLFDMCRLEINICVFEHGGAQFRNMSNLSNVLSAFQVQNLSDCNLRTFDVFQLLSFSVFMVKKLNCITNPEIDLGNTLHIKIWRKQSVDENIWINCKIGLKWKFLRSVQIELQKFHTNFNRFRDQYLLTDQQKGWIRIGTSGYLKLLVSTNKSCPKLDLPDLLK